MFSLEVFVTKVETTEACEHLPRDKGRQPVVKIQLRHDPIIGFCKANK